MRVFKVFTHCNPSHSFTSSTVASATAVSERLPHSFVYLCRITGRINTRQNHLATSQPSSHFLNFVLHTVPTLYNMFRSHTRTRSLISVKTIVYQDEKELYDEDTADEVAAFNHKSAGLHHQQMTLVYLLFLVEAIMASSLSSQINLLVEPTVSCYNLNALFLRSLLECTYIFGGTCGVFWGVAADRLGRRPVALLGLAGMIICCLSMGFVKSLAGYMIFRFLAGSVGSALLTSGLAMLADISIDSAEQTNNVACLPLVAVCGSVGPMLQSLVKQLEQSTSIEILKQWPALSGQIACASLIIIIAVPEALYLMEVRGPLAANEL